MPDEMLRALGSVVVEFNLVDFVLSTGIAVMASSDFVIGQTVASELSIRAKTNVFFSILRHLHKSEEVIREFDALRKRVLAAEEDRNQLIHSLWGADASSGDVLRTKASAPAKRGFTTVQERLSSAEVSKKAQEFHRLAEDLVTFYASSKTPWQWPVSRGETSA